MGKTIKDTTARVAERRKEIKERAAKQLCMDNISTSSEKVKPPFLRQYSVFFEIFFQKLEIMLRALF